MRHQLGTIITAAATPMRPDGSVDLNGFRRLVTWLADHGSDGIVVAGTTGESATLRDDEKLLLIEAAVATVGDRVSVIAGTGSNDTEASMALTRAAVSAGASAVLVVTPYYNKPPRQGIVRHIQQVAAAAGDADVILYNIPQRVVLNLEPELVAELAQIDNVVALKQANPDLDQTRQIRELAPDLAIYAGNDDLLIDLLPLGAVGAIMVASHIVGDEIQEMVSAARAGDMDRARQIDAQLHDVYEMLSLSVNPIPLKAALDVMALPGGPPRLPLVPATPSERARIRSVLDARGLEGVGNGARGSAARDISH